jgi:hypothetical protein
MTNKINMIINLMILALLIYLAIGITELRQELIWPEGFMQPLSLFREVG